MRLGEARVAMTDLIDLERYPIDRLASAEGRDLVAFVRSQLADDGCCRLPGFLTAPALRRAAADCDARRSKTFRSTSQHNVYFCADDPALPADHPVRILQKGSQGFIAADYFEDDTVIKQLFHYEPLTDFVSTCLDIAPIYRSADPIACCPVSVQEAEQAFPWHFDGNEFTVTMMLQSAESGGVFEYAPMIRSPHNEAYDAVRALLQGDRSLVRSLALKDGDLQIFKGKYSAHRVTAVAGGRPRYLAALAWMPKPGMVNTVERSLSGYGRALDVHYRRRAVSDDGLQD